MKKFTYILFLCVVAISLMTQEAYAYHKVTVRQDTDLVKVFAGKDTKFVIKEDIDLGGKTVKMGEGCMLAFKGGSLANGKVVGNKTKVKASNYEIFKRGYTRYRAYIADGASKGAAPSLQKVYHNCIVLEGTWLNKKCGTKWTGVLNESNEDVMLAVKNFVVLHADGAKVKFPTFKGLGYEGTKFPENHYIDFNHSEIDYPDNLNLWEDKTISIPKGSKPTALESGYGLISISSNTTIANLSVDGKSSFRQDETLRLGVSCIISIGGSRNVTIDNVSLSNVLGPAMTAQSGAKDITIKNCRFFNIGEHVLYSHQYQGFCHFENCTFDTWDSERISVFRNGLNYLYKHTPPVDGGKATYEELYRFDLRFDKCVFNNPKRVNTQGRTLGGFFTGSFPLVVNINNCTFTGAQPPFNPGGGATISEKSGKYFMMVVRACDGAPYVYSSKANYNIVTEFYDCVNIPFRTVYARRYENCKLFLDLHEENIENVSESFEREFSQPLVIKNCELSDGGRDVKINHPVFHRPVTFEGCSFKSVGKRKNQSDVVTVKVEGLPKASFKNCEIDLPAFRLAGGKQEVTVQHVNSKQ